jgi:hypothetical protein
MVTDIPSPPREQPTTNAPRQAQESFNIERRGSRISAMGILLAGRAAADAACTFLRDSGFPVNPRSFMYTSARGCRSGSCVDRERSPENRIRIGVEQGPREGPEMLDSC